MVFPQGRQGNVTIGQNMVDSPLAATTPSMPHEDGAEQSSSPVAPSSQRDPATQSRAAAHETSGSCETAGGGLSVPVKPSAVDSDGSYDLHEGGPTPAASLRGIRPAPFPPQSSQTDPKAQARLSPQGASPPPPTAPHHGPNQRWTLGRTRNAVVTFGKFVGPGFMIAVAYSKHLSNVFYGTPNTSNHAFQIPSAQHG